MAMARLIIDPPLPGPANMARDEVLLQTCAPADAPPVLRFYAWSPPTISLGYFQDFAEYERLPTPAGDLPVVRRTTGGGAILHDLELTYAIVIPLSHPLVKGCPNHLYELAHEAVIKAIGHGVRMFGHERQAVGESHANGNPQSAIRNPQFSQRGPFFCFARRHGLDIIIDEPRASSEEPRASARAAPVITQHAGGVAKIAGSAQRRTAAAILQHGSIMLDSRYPQQPVATWSAIDAPISFDQAAGRLIPAFEAALAVTFTQDHWRDEELTIAKQIETRYAGAPWTVHRKHTSADRAPNHHTG